MIYEMTPWRGLTQYSNEMVSSGGNLFYYQNKNADAKKPTLVFIHGLGDEADTWRHILPALINEGYNCIAPDLPGFGRSIWRGKISVSCHANTIIDLLDKRGVREPVVLIGSSMGGGIAELIAFKRPDLVKALFLIDGSFPLTMSVNPELLFAGLPFIGKNWYRGFQSNHEGAWKSLYAYYGNLDAMSDEDKQFLRDRVIARVHSDNQERGYFASLRSNNAVFMFQRRYYSRRVKNFKGKILLAWGEKDRVVSVNNTASFTKLRPDAEIKIIPGAGHLPHQENPGEIIKALRDFLKTL
jgi:pimeloyl-ACP methyl ester carboxylesterase